MFGIKLRDIAMLPYYSIIIVFFILAGLSAVAWVLRRIVKDNKSKDWPQADATIFYDDTQSSVNNIPDINFRYTVSGHLYEQKIKPEAEEITMPGFLDHFKKKYPDGETLTVFYQLDSPELTTFTPGAKLEDKIILALCLSAVMVGVYAITI